MKNKILKIVISCVLAVVAIGGITTAFLLNYNSLVPSGIEIMENDEQSYLIAKANTNYKGYRFVFASGDEKVTIDTDENVISLSQCLENGISLGKTYSVKFCYLASDKGNNSKFSKEILFETRGYLKAPVVSYSESQNAIVWNNVLNADYYIVYYNDVSAKSVKVNECKFSLDNVATGRRNFYVVAYSNVSYINASKSSNVVSHTVVREMQGFSAINFDTSSKILTLKSQEDLKEIIVYIGENEYSCYKFDKTFVEAENAYNYSIDLSILYKDGLKVGAKPANIDDYNYFVGQIVYA